MDSYGEAKERVVNDMKRLLSDTEDLLRAVGIDSKDKVAALRPRVEAAISQARTHLSEMERAVEQGARRAARQADAYVHENPWRTAGAAAGLGAALGAIVGVLLARR
jgi:ElaB/YqjD/DUF883 family membrane-anchored ribosome-binding protein